jgi:hypothetical protein
MGRNGVLPRLQVGADDLHPTPAANAPVDVDGHSQRSAESDSKVIHRKFTARHAMIGCMTETPEHPNEPTPAAAESAAGEPRSRWDGRWDHRPFRIYRLAALLVILASIVFIIAVVFWSGFLLGAHGGGHHGDEGAGSRHEKSMMHYGAPMELTFPSVAVTT